MQPVASRRVLFERPCSASRRRDPLTIRRCIDTGRVPQRRSPHQRSTSTAEGPPLPPPRHLLSFAHIHCLYDMGNRSFRPHFPPELSTNIFRLLALPSSDSPWTRDPTVRSIDVGYFPEKEDEALSRLRNTALVNKHFASMTLPLLLKVVHLQRAADIISFHSLTLPNALTNSHWVKELQFSLYGRKEDIVAVVHLCATILNHLPNLSKLDLSTSQPWAILGLYEDPNGTSAYDRLWRSIPYSNQYNGRLQLLDQFVEAHPLLDTWSFYTWTVEDHIYLEREGAGLLGNDIDGLRRRDDIYSLDFADVHLFRLLKQCRVLEIKEPETCWEPNEDAYPLVCKHWTYPRISYLSSSFVYFWPKDFRCATIQKVRCVSPTFKQVRRILTQLTNLSTFIYQPSEENSGFRTWRKGVSSKSLKHVMAFIWRWDFEGLHDANIKNLLSPSPPDITMNHVQTSRVCFSKGIQCVRKEFLALEDKKQFPSLEKLSLYIHPSQPPAPPIDIKNKLESALRDAFQAFAGIGVEVAIDWGTCHYSGNRYTDTNGNLFSDCMRAGP